MSGRDVEGFLTRNGLHELVNIRVSQGADGQMCACFNGSIFNGWVANVDQINQLMSILRCVREELGGANERTT